MFDHMAEMIVREKFRFMQDNDSHWFLVPAKFTEREFWEWIRIMESEDVEELLEQYNGPDFDEFRIDGWPGFYTVENPQRDKE